MNTKLVLRLLVALAMGAPAVTSAADRNDKRTSKPAASTTAKVDVNTADLATLETLPGVGPQTAKAIIAGRPYSSVDDLERVPGIGAARLNDLRGQVTASRGVSNRAAKQNPVAKDTTRKETPADRASTARKHTDATRRGRIDVNTADAETLESLPGVGPEIAEAIIAARPFRSVAELEAVRGIGPARMSELRDLVTVSPISRQATTSDASRRATSSRSEREPVLTPTGRSSEARRGDSATNRDARRINLNTASKEELEALPEIGPVKAQAIIDARPFSTVEDVMRVKGIKEGTFDAIRDQITVR